MNIAKEITLFLLCQDGTFIEINESTLVFIYTFCVQQRLKERFPPKEYQESKHVLSKFFNKKEKDMNVCKTFIYYGKQFWKEIKNYNPGRVEKIKSMK